MTNEFFSRRWLLKPVDNWKGEPCIKSAAPSGTARPRTASLGNPSAVTPDRAVEYKEEDLATPHTATQPVAAGVRTTAKTRNSDEPPAGVMPLGRIASLFGSARFSAQRLQLWVA